jgi:hypothetical protein
MVAGSAQHIGACDVSTANHGNFLLDTETMSLVDWAKQRTLGLHYCLTG